MGQIRELPVGLLQVQEFKALTEQETCGFQSRLQLVEECVQEMELWLSGAETGKRSLWDLLNDVELDLSVSQGVPQQGRGVSNWLIHTSWTFEFTASLARELGPDLRRGVDRDPPHVGSEEGVLAQWLRGECASLRAALDGFYTATSPSSAVAHLIAMNSIVSALLFGFCRARL